MFNMTRGKLPLASFYGIEMENANVLLIILARILIQSMNVLISGHNQLTKDSTPQYHHLGG